MKASAESGTIEALVVLFADRVAELLAVRLAASPPHPEYATAKHNPLGAARTFLGAARRGAFPSYKVGREVRARWLDVVAFVEAAPRQPRGGAVNLEAELAAAAAPRRGCRRG